MSEPIQPPNHNLTPEALAHLAEQQSQNGHIVTDSVEGSLIEGNEEPQFFADFPSAFSSMDNGDTIDAEIINDTEVEPSVAPGKRQRTKRESQTPREAKTGPPSLDEWTRFFSRVVLRVATEYYISYAFRGVNENALSDREVERLAMTDEERQLIAVPFAEISNKSKFMRKHGRMIVASGDSFNAILVFGMWASRVNRIASRYRKQDIKVTKGNLNGSSRQGTTDPSPQEGSTGGRFPQGFTGTIYPGSG